MVWRSNVLHRGVIARPWRPSAAASKKSGRHFRTVTFRGRQRSQIGLFHRLPEIYQLLFHCKFNQCG
jgi:hypothetical protein